MSFRRSGAWAGAALGVGSLLLGSAALAQETSDKDSKIETVVVTAKMISTNASTATKTDTPIIETPQSISVINQQQLILQNPQDLNQAIGYSSGVTPNEFGYDPRFAQFQIRGFSELYNGIYQDGLRLFGYDYTAPLLEPYGLEQIDIVRGPTSVLYGQNAPGGLINLVSKRPETDPFGEVEVQVGSYDRYQGQFDLNGPLTDDGTVLARLTGLYRQADTQYRNTPDDETYLAPAITFHPRSGTTLTILGSFERVAGGESDEFYASYLLPPGYPQTVYHGEKGFDHSTQYTYNIGYLLNQELGDGWTLNQSFRYSDAKADLQFPNVLYFDTATTIARQAENLTNKLSATTVDTNVVGKVSTGPLNHTLIFGIDYQNSPISIVDLVGPAPDLDYFNPVYGLPIPKPTSLAAAATQRLEQTGIYAQDQIKYGEHWALTGGLRQDWSSIKTTNHPCTGPDCYTFFDTGAVTSQKDNALTGRVGLVYISDIGLAPYVSYSTSFLPQTGTDYTGHPFGPLNGKQYEGGVRYQPKSGWISATASVYDLTEQHVLSADPNPAHLGFSVETGEERSRGFEFETQANPLPGLNLTAAYTYNDVRITKTTDPTQLNHHPMVTPPTQVSIFADYTFQDGLLKGFGGGGGLRYASESFDAPDNLHKNGAQIYLDADLHYEFGQWRLAVNGTNLANSQIPVCFTGVCNFSRDRSIIGSIARRF